MRDCRKKLSRLSWLVLPVVAMGCQGSAPQQEELKATTRTWVNGGFESGTAGTVPTGWTVTTGINPGVTIQTPQTRAGLNIGTGGNQLTTTLFSAAGPESQPDSFLGAGASLRWPKYGNQVALVNQGGTNQNVNSLSQTMIVAQGDVDPSDGQVHVRFVVAPVLENPSHTAPEQPYYFVQLTNLSRGNAILYVDYNASAQPGVPWKISNSVYYTDWQLVDISPGSAGLAIGDSVKLEVIGSGCSLGGHYGQVYVDGLGPTVPGAFVSGTAVAAANAGTDITYTLHYQNGGTTAVAGAAVDFNTPANTTFASLSAPGLTCTTPAVGAAGLVTCSLGTLAAAAGGTFEVSVLIAGAATGIITEGNYSIYGTAENPLLGPKVYTTVTSGVTYADLALTLSDGVTGVTWGEPVSYTIVASNNGPNTVTGATVTDTLSADFTGASWTCIGAGGASCAAAGTGNVADATVMIPVGGTVTYTITGAVIAGTGTAQLADTASIAVPAGASDPNTANNSAGVFNTITSANGAACTTAAGCSSGVCDAPSGTCIPVGGCGADIDCAAGQYCNNPTFTCVPQLANGTPIPTVASHSPALTGVCSPAVGTSVCISGVCDTDNSCGLGTGDGPCSAVTGAVVCRSGTCSTNLTCEPMGGCDVDADCTGNSWCNETLHACTLQIANGGAIPTDSAHTAPTLAGLCTAAAAALVCQSGVCDSDNNCGYNNGDGPCTVATGTIVCRSGACDGTDLLCGYINGDGPCTNGAVCRSSACDPDGNCGYAIGDGPCTTGTETLLCRSDVCASSPPLNGTCEQCASDGDCSGATPACDVTRAVCVPCTATNTTACSGATPVCSTTTEACRACNGDNGGGATLACTTTVSPYCFASGPNAGSCGVCGTNSDCVGEHGGPICNLTTGACGSTCAVDTDCVSTQWCSSGSCSPKVANGQPLPAAAPINGTCTSPNGARVCLSAVCGSDNECGFANGSGPCASATTCRSGICPTTGANMGTCEQCGSDTDCSSPTPACDTTLNTCVQCTTMNGNACVATTPICVTASETCGACGGDNGTAAAGSCPSSLLPYCSSTGACGKCTTSSDCTGNHAGAVCDSATGTCGTACQANTDCITATQWCSIPTGGQGACVPKLANGSLLPTSAGACTVPIGQQICTSGVCDPTDNECGLQNGDGPCSSGAMCVSGICTAMLCAAPSPPDAGTKDSGTDSGVKDAAVAHDSGAPHDSSAATDSGRHDAGGHMHEDAGRPDGKITMPDSGAAEEAEARQPDAAAAGAVTVGGGGCSTSPGSTNDSTSGIFGLLVGVAFMAARRRRQEQ